MTWQLWYHRQMQRYKNCGKQSAISFEISNFAVSILLGMKNNKNKLLSEVTEYLIIGLSMIAGGFGWSAFLLPHHITIGGLGGFASVLYWGTGIPIVYTYVAVNALLMILALRTLGWRFCVRTIYAVIIFSAAVAIFQPIFEQHILFSEQPFLACIVGGAFLGVTMGFALQYNASTGGSDVIAAIVHKYRDISLGRVILICDVCVITSSYIVLHSWESIIYGYIALVVISYSVDRVINGMRQSVQFLIVSDHWEEMGHSINMDAKCGCTVIDAHGFYTGKKKGMLFIIAHRQQSHKIMQIIHETDPDAFVSQSPVSGVYGLGFNKMKVKS